MDALPLEGLGEGYVSGTVAACRGSRKHAQPYQLGWLSLWREDHGFRVAAATALSNDAAQKVVLTQHAWLDTIVAHHV